MNHSKEYFEKVVKKLRILRKIIYYSMLLCLIVMIEFWVAGANVPFLKTIIAFILFMVIITFVKNFISQLSLMSDDIYINYENNLQLMNENSELKQKLKNDKNLLK